MSLAVPHLAEDRRLPFLADAWSRRGRLELVRNLVRSVRAVAVEDMTYTPERECLVLYRIELDDGSTTRVVATLSKDDRLREVFERHYGRGGAAAYLPERRCLLELFPADWRLPGLATALTALSGARPSVLRYRPHARCVLGYEPVEVIGKVFRHPEKAEREWWILSALHPEAAALGVAVPKPLAYVEASRLVLMERLAGVPLKHVLQRATPAEAAELAALGGAALSILHGLRVDGGEPRTLESELADLRRKAARVSRVAPAFGGEVERVLLDLERLAPPSSTPLGTFVHGDFKPSQLLLDGARLAVVDFDRVAPGDPALDVGNFAAQFRKESVVAGREHLRTLGQVFLAEYGNQAIAERARLFEALALARMAVRRFRRSPHVYARDGAASLPVLLLREAAACLES